MRLKRLAALAASFAVLLAAQPAQASKRCAKVRVTAASGEKIRATVRVERGRARCRVARKVARAILSGRARYHEGDSHADSYYIVGNWEGGISTGAWAATNQVTGAYIIGQIH
ncbi:MAG TPA: hypothetical protein VF533_22690 [Solirubrobacteraceae bacterium]|jgi:hypothetical protein